MYIDTGSTINLTCIVKHLPEPPPGIYWTHNGEVGQASILCYVETSSKSTFQDRTVLELEYRRPVSRGFITRNIIFNRLSCSLLKL